ncbi:Crinkler (CRN) [Phytophthora megakarya]|uniref:Crinkler (CRN) n=1 Tax=Phytophthora megakarya TaxID=4795 RepID=A0A225V1D8_9STRA|nr:Crinkler (CRN) [Phytophthora megakarya]
MKSLVRVGIRDRRVFVEDIDERKKVFYLKDTIKEKKMYDFPGGQLTLYITTTTDKWLTDMTMLENGGVPSGIKDIMKKKNKMNPLYRIGNNAGEHETHVLVELPNLVVGAGLLR